MLESEVSIEIKEVGDEMLRQVVGVLKESLRINDVVARYGGGEFIAMFTDTDGKGVLTVAKGSAEE